MDSNTGKSLLPGLAPFLANPTTLTALGIGAAGWVILKWLFEDEEGKSEPPLPNSSEPSLEPLAGGLSTVEDPLGVQDEPLLGTVDPRGSWEVDEPSEGPPNTVGEPLHPLSREDEEEVGSSELIRQAMSELGKRSAAARARKRAGQD